ncbi:MAG: peptide chain release factor-like protein [Proteobacteria bacterium]|nr:peptide chain release factor-like protein [Pseudomonadota bacterium]
MDDPFVYNSGNWLDILRKTDEEILRLSRMDVFKGSGRGGQKRNKTSNAIRLTLSHLSVTESASRSRAANIDRAIRKIRLAIALDISQAAETRCRFQDFPDELRPYLGGNAIRINPKNPVFPIFAGCLIDVFIKHKGNWSKTAREYQTSPSQIRKFVEKNGFLTEPLKKLESQFSKVSERL